MSYSSNHPYGPGLYYNNRSDDISLKYFKDSCEHVWMRNFTACRMHMMEHMNQELLKIPPGDQLTEIKKYVQKKGSELMSLSLSFDDVEHYASVIIQQPDDVSISSSSQKPYTATLSTIHSLHNGQLKIPYISRVYQPIFKEKILEICKSTEDDIIYVKNNSDRVKTEITALFEIIKNTKEFITQEMINNIIQSFDE
jgi:hypothetical protein